MKVLYQDQTKRAHLNFPFPVHPVYIELIQAIAMVKQACAIANNRAGFLDKRIKDAIVKACKEIISGKHDEQFVISSLQGGAGTSINMNLNEVIATLATEFLKGNVVVHPNDHVNMSQSTNDVNPTALKIACVFMTESLIKACNKLILALNSKSREFKNVHKLGRTHLQDAVPTTLGAEFNAYSSVISRDLKAIIDDRNYLLNLNLGGTAIGNRINASALYIKNVYPALRKVTGIVKLKMAGNLMAQTGFQSDFCHLSSSIMVLCTDLSKIAHDIRFMASGPKGGLAELKLEELQAGSSIMPGKVNPIMPESVNQLYYFVSGKHISILQAGESASLELAVMFPTVADAIISSLLVATSVISQFTDKCISTIEANKESCKLYLERSNAYATFLTPVLGYDVVSKLVKEALQKNLTLREIVVGNKYLTDKKFDEIVKS